VRKCSLPHSKVHPAGLQATLQVTRLVLSGKNIRRKRHESVMSSVIKKSDIPKNLRRYLTGEPLLNFVKRELGY